MTMPFPHAGRSVFIAVAASVLLCAASGCGADSSPAPTAPASTTSTTATTAGCVDVSALEKSLNALADVNLRQDGVASLKSAIADVKSGLSTARASAAASLKPGLEQVQSAFSALETAASGLTADNLLQKTPGIVSALKQVGAATRAFTATVAEDCPGS